MAFDPPRLHHVKFSGCPRTSRKVQKALGIKAGNPRRRLSDGGGLYLLRNSGRFKRINNFLPTWGQLHSEKYTRLYQTERVLLDGNTVPT
jgi:hypothetical protein